MLDNRRDQTVDSVLVQGRDVLCNYVLYSSRLYQLIEFFAELSDVLVDASAVRETSGDRELRIGGGYDDRLREYRLTPVPDLQQLADSSGKEDELRQVACDVCPDILERSDEYILPRASVQRRSLLVDETLGNGAVHPERELDRTVIVHDYGLLALMSRPVILIREIFLFQPACSELSVVLPGVAGFKDRFDLFL